MAGRRHRDFRSGDLNEELGILLLKGIAAVATVPRPEDVGVDAIATLLREGPNDFLIAENSFFVQFKSATDKKVEFKEHEVRWLETLKLPYFIGSVRKADSAIDLYAAHRLSQALLESRYDKIELLLDPENKTHRGIDPKTEAITDSFRSVNIGPPLLSWSTLDLANAEFSRQAYACIKPYLDAEQRNIDYREIRYIELISWETGQPPHCSQGSAHYQGMCEDEIHRAFRSMAPHLLALKLRAWMTNDRSVLEVVVQLVDYMRRCGFDPDPNNTFQMQLDHWDELAIPTDISPRGHPD